MLTKLFHLKCTVALKGRGVNIYYLALSHDQTLSANQRSLNVRYISCNHALVS